MLSTFGLAVVLFVATNVDDLFVLLAFLANPRYRAGQVVVGQYLGIAALVLASLAASAVSLVLAPEYVGLLGLLPIAIGIKELIALAKGDDDDDEAPASAGVGNTLAVAAVTVANGGDNIGVYVPVFATANWPDIATICIVFAVLIAAWVAFARWLVRHPALGAPIRRLAPIAVPFVLIGIGVLVLYDSGSFALLRL